MKPINHQLIPLFLLSLLATPAVMGATADDVGVDHCSIQMAVAEKLLDGADVGAVLKKVGSE